MNQTITAPTENPSAQQKITVQLPCVRNENRITTHGAVYVLAQQVSSITPYMHLYCRHSIKESNVRLFPIQRALEWRQLQADEKTIDAIINQSIDQSIFCNQSSNLQEKENGQQQQQHDAL